MAGTGCVFYRGPSLLTGEPIVAIATGLDGESLNRKTGPMVQTWVLRPDVRPMDAVRSGTDRAICGDCGLRGEGGYDRKCYVSTSHGPAQVYKSFIANNYPEVSWAELHALMEGRSVRICAYGDPAAVSYEVWRELLATAATWTAYTHSWSRADPRLKTIAMASVDTVDEFIRAGWAGWRTFRVRRTLDEPLIAGGEFVCPASDEAGHRTTCQRCQLCRGTSSPARSVVIVAHGKPSTLRAFGVRVPMFGRPAPRPPVEACL